MRDIGQLDRESFVGPAAALRELVTVVLRELAPDSSVQAESGYAAQTRDGQPSRSQRVKFVLKRKKRGSEEAVNRVLDGLDKIVRETYDRASKETHLGLGGRTEIATLADYVHGVLRDLLLE